MPEFGEALQRELRRLGVVDELALHRVNRLHAAGDLGGEFQRDTGYAMTVAVQQVARAHGEPTYAHRSAGFHNVDVGMRNGNVAREEMKGQGLDLIEISYRTVGDRANASQGPVQVGVDFAPE